ncbi:flagellar hook-length control protein [Hyphomonas neptunium ATCC 15444]|uniref:Flagellar hook-length control protein n=2 Tax=Hyphomonas TaxID=85 RepID=Q0C5K1_HYPNA|nr:MULTISPECIES: flagellar hook-length control protein FliK [Hyphomonas]ABI77431.1 flagellar hook-length control protein [Hyphomonas neptunium ATCC 15444]KCZ95420.1 flagellar hook-length control protein [Hyphomonas hirschiana VP5]
MTFSVDVDFWPFQAGPPQDAIARQGAGEGRGKDFASSLFGVAPEAAASVDLMLGPSDSTILASLNLLQAAAPSPEVAPAEDVPATPEIDGQIPAPDLRPALDASTGEDLPPDNPAATAEDVPTQTEPAFPDPVDTALAGIEPPALSPDETAESEPPQDEKTVPRAEASLVMGPPVAAPAGSMAKTETLLAATAAGAQPTGKMPLPDTGQPAAPSRRAVNAAAEAAAQTDMPADLLATASDEPVPAIGAMSFEASNSDSGGTGTNSQTGSTITSPALSGAIGQTSASPQAPANPAAAQLTPTHAVLMATPAQLPEIVARATHDGKDDSVVVQLDPPELGRVSIDFKFDAQGLQHVTITAESPEAMRQLRQMHFELVQALERNGLSGQNMSFQHQNPQQNEGWGQQAKLTGARFDTPALTGGGLVIAADNGPNRQTASNGRLDIRL